MTEFATITPLLRPGSIYAVNHAVRHGGGYFSIQHMPSREGLALYAQYIGHFDAPTPKKRAKRAKYRVRVRLKPAGVAAIRAALAVHLANRRDELNTRRWR